MGAVFFTLLAASASAQEEKSTVRETHGDWDIRCVAEGPCLMEQIVKKGDGTPSLVMRILKFKEPVEREGKTAIAQAEIQVRAGYYLASNLGMKIDENQPIGFAYHRCLQGSCFSQPLLTQKEIDSFKNGGKATFIMVIDPSKGTAEEASVSLSGFTAAFGAL